MLSPLRPSPLRPLSSLQYLGPGKLVSAIYYGTCEECDQDRYMILVRRDPDYIVAVYGDGDWEWEDGHYFESHAAALSALLQMAASRWDIDWTEEWPVAK